MKAEDRVLMASYIWTMSNQDVESRRSDDHMANSTKTFPGSDGKTEDAIDAAVNAMRP
ncbi:hypothetical protein NQZ68_020114 [Dissostichus eleginoides]|nr:hypothetical protein NQZ68_020114 [Dissostichus eleginoides]